MRKKTKSANGGLTRSATPSRSIFTKSEVAIFTSQIGSDRACSPKRGNRPGQISTQAGISDSRDHQLSVDVRHAMIHARPPALAGPAPPRTDCDQQAD